MPRRRRGQDQPRALVAAATRINLKTKQPKRTPTTRQTEAWEHAREVPEVSQLIRWRGNQLAKLRFFVATMPPDAGPDADPIPAADPDSGIDAGVAQRAEAELARLKSRLGGRAEIVRRLERNLEKVGEAWIVGYGARLAGELGPDGKELEEDVPEDWTVASIKEVTSKNRSTADGQRTVYVVKRHPDDKKGRELDADRDTIFRVWSPDDEWWELADSPVMGIHNECEALIQLANEIVAQSRSRVSAGLLLVPTGLSFGGPDPTEDEGGDEGTTDPFMDELVVAIASPAENPRHASAVVPMLVRGDKDELEQVRHITLGRDTGEDVDARIEAEVKRAARGLDAPVEVVMGHQQTTFANAEQVDADTWEDFLESRAIFMADVFTVGFLHPLLLDEDDTPGAPAPVPAEIVERLFVWFDASDLVAQPDVESNADSGLEKSAISWMAWRKSKGFSEEDAPEPLEMLVRAGLRGPLSPELVHALLEMLGEPIDVTPLPSSGGNGQAADGAQAAAARTRELARLLLAQHGQAVARASMRAGAVPARAEELRGGSGASRDRSAASNGERLVAIDRELRARLIMAANEAMERALERAGNRLKSRQAVRSTLRRVPALLAASTVGRDAVVAAGTSPEELLDGAFDALEKQFRTWGARSQRQALDVVNRVVGGFTSAERDRLGLRMADSLDEAWSWMEESLRSLAHARLFDPTPAAPALGEFDAALRVPPGLVRQAVARAGGAAGLDTSGRDAWVAVSDGGRAPAGGVATGEIVQDALRDEGAGIEGWQWDYGPAFRSRPFEPHVELDGVTFENFDDDVLANGESFPEFDFYMPGDHSGCLCDVIPVIALPGESGGLHAPVADVS